MFLENKCSEEEFKTISRWLGEEGNDFRIRLQLKQHGNTRDTSEDVPRLSGMSILDKTHHSMNLSHSKGGEWHSLWLESTHSENVEIRNCTFRSNNLNILYGGRKRDMAIMITSHSMPPVELMQNIRIHHNTFENEGICVDVTQCDGLWFWNNEIINCTRDLEVEEASTSNIHRTALK